MGKWGKKNSENNLLGVCYLYFPKQSGPWQWIFCPPLLTSLQLWVLEGRTNAKSVGCFSVPHWQFSCGQLLINLLVVNDQVSIGCGKYLQLLVRSVRIPILLKSPFPLTQIVLSLIFTPDYLLESLWGAFNDLHVQATCAWGKTQWVWVLFLFYFFKLWVSSKCTNLENPSFSTLIVEKNPMSGQGWKWL